MQRVWLLCNSYCFVVCAFAAENEGTLVIVCSKLPFSHVHCLTLHCTCVSLCICLLPLSLVYPPALPCPAPLHRPLSPGQAVYVTATFPFLILAVLFFRGVTLEGAGEGLRYLFIPRDVSVQ